MAYEAWGMFHPRMARLKNRQRCCIEKNKQTALDVHFSTFMMFLFPISRSIAKNFKSIDNFLRLTLRRTATGQQEHEMYKYSRYFVNNAEMCKKTKVGGVFAC